MNDSPYIGQASAFLEVSKLKGKLSNYMENNPVKKLRHKKGKEKLYHVLNFIGVIAHLSKFCIFSLMNDG